MTNKFTKIYETALETQDLVQKQELREDWMDNPAFRDAWENLGPNDRYRTANLVGLGAATASAGLAGLAAIPGPQQVVTVPVAAVANAGANAYDLMAGTAMAVDSYFEDDPELKNEKLFNAGWNLTSAVPILGDAAQLARRAKVAGLPIMKNMLGLPGANKALAAASTLKHPVAQAGIGVASPFVADKAADALVPDGAAAREDRTKSTEASQAQHDLLAQMHRANRAAALGPGNYTRVNQPVSPRGFASRQPLIAHFERVGKGLAQNLMEQLDPVGNKPTDAVIIPDEGAQDAAERNERATERARTRAANQGGSSWSKFGRGAARLAAPVTVAGLLAGIAPLVYGRLSRDKSTPAALGEIGSKNVTGGIQDAIERLQGMVGSAGQIAQYAPPGIGELGRRAAATLTGVRA